MVASKLDKKLALKDRRFLITQSSLRLLAGSEINVLELADYLQSNGAIVTVYTHFFSKPISTYFDDKNIQVITDDEQLDVDDYDYVWVHHQTIPPSFVEKISHGSVESLPIFIFLHMSGLKTHFLEQSYIWDFEKRIASKVLFVSDETKGNIANNSMDISKLDTGLYRNPTPIKFTKINHIPRKGLKRVLIVSNHPAKEVLDAAALLRKEDIKVVMAGEGQKKYKLIEPEYLSEFDVVITIGKTVQYCLVSGIPVYVYDVWGGPGYLDINNEKNAVWYNFSGRGFDKKDALTIAEEITGGYSTTVKYQSDNRARFIEKFSMDSILPKIIEDAKSRDVKPFDKYYSQYLKASLTMFKYKFYHENLLIQRDEELNSLRGTLQENKETVYRQNEEIARITRDIEEIHKSRAFRLGLVLAKPVRLTKHLLAHQEKSQ